MSHEAKCIKRWIMPTSFVLQSIEQIVIYF